MTKYMDRLSMLIPIEQLDSGAQTQIWKNLELDILKKLVILPDCHQGYDLPIGSVALIDSHISPSYVGFDIGCGIIYLNTQIHINDLLPKKKNYEQVFENIYKQIPCGLGLEHKVPAKYPEFNSTCLDKKLINQVNVKIGAQLGTLGHGNHFIEIGKNNSNEVCIVIHSGSRRPGYLIAEYYMKQGRFFEIDSELGQSFLADLNFALNFALHNRYDMMKNVLRVLKFSEHKIPGLMKNVVNENHNHAIVTEDGILHRKGATPADEGQIGIIPGNMRDGTYITKGLGNVDYLSSSSHGCGRTMSRSKASKSIDLDKHRKAMKGIVARVDKSTLDESPMAYKNLDKVIAMQKGVVIDVIDKITPLINIKGVSGRRY